MNFDFVYMPPARNLSQAEALTPEQFEHLRDWFMLKETALRDMLVDIN